LAEKSSVIPTDVLRALKSDIPARFPGLAFDLVFMDPPYKKDLVVPALEAIGAGKLLKSGGTVIVEADASENLPESIGEFRIADRRNYGRTTILFFKGV
jgi:16S rRNA G966 N2-methylase RsmD